MIRRLDVKNKGDHRLLGSLRRLQLIKEWQEFQGFLETELHRLDIANRTAEPYQASRIGAAAETLQAVIDKVVTARKIQNLSQK